MAKVQINSSGKVYCDSNNKVLLSGGYEEIPKYEVVGNVAYRRSIDLTGQFGGIQIIAPHALDYCFNYNGFVGDVSFPDLTVIQEAGMNYTFNTARLSSASFPELVSIDNSGLTYCFASMTTFTSASFPKLETVESSGMTRAFNGCSALTSVSLPELKTAKGNGLSYCFTGCSILETVTFTKLENLQYGSVLTGAFQTCAFLKNIYFPALKTTSFTGQITQFNSMFNTGTSGTAVTSGNVNVHFPSNLQSTISGLTGYPLFGGQNGRITLLFDLPATS